MSRKFRIAILGMGGVGGFIGGKLARKYAGSDSIEVIFIARGATKEVITEKGLQVTTASEQFIARPDLVSDAPTEIGVVDLLICCMKAYDLEASMEKFSACIGPNTLVMPLLNGVDNADRIKKVLPGANVLDGCIYIVSKIINPGVILQRGEFHVLHFGSNDIGSEQLAFVGHIFTDAGINAIQEPDIRLKLWTKFAFISPIATYTSAYNVCKGEIMEDEQRKEELRQLMEELLMLAATLNIPLPADTVGANFNVMSKLPAESTSSMQADFINGKRTELESLTGYVICESRKHNLHLPHYENLYQLLASR